MDVICEDSINGMAMDYFITYTIKDKIALLQGLTESLLTGQIVRVKTSRDSETEFSPKVDNSLMYQRLCNSIVNDGSFDLTDPVQAACINNLRQSSTRVRFNTDRNF